MIKTGTFDSIFPFEFIENDCLISKSGAVALGFRCKSLPLPGKLSEHDLEGVHHCLTQALSQLPTGAIFQKIDVFFEKEFKLKEKGQHLKHFLGKKWNDYYNYRPALCHQSFIFLIFSNELVERNPATSFFSKAAGSNKVFRNPLADIDKLVEIAKASAASFMASLTMISGLELIPLSDDDLSTFIFRYMELCFDSSDKLSTEYVKLSDRALTTTLSNSGAFRIGQNHISMVSMVGQGKTVSTSSRGNLGCHDYILSPVLAELDFPHIIVQGIMMCDTAKELRRLDVTRSMLNSFSGQRDQDGAIQEGRLLDFSAEIRRKGGELVKYALQICLFDADPTVLARMTNRTVAALTGINGTKVCVESYDAANIFFASVPGNAAENYRWILMPATNAACYIPFGQFFQGNQEGMLLCDRYKQPIYLNFWNEHLDNKNKLIVGPSGSGKSFTVNSFITQHISDGDQVFIIDVGGSYLSLFRLINGLYIDYGGDTALQFNPFLCDMEGNRYVPNQEKLNFLVNLMAVLWKAEEEIMLKTERAILNRHIVAYYEYLTSTVSERPCLNSFYTFLKASAQENENSHLDLAGLLIILSEYATGGTRARLLNAPGQLDLNNFDLVCFDMNGIKEDETLYSIVSLLIIDLVLGKLRQNPDRKKHLYMDEAWSMLKDTLGDFVMGMFRTIRKSNGAVTIITQGIDEIERSLVGKAILQNAATKILLDHSSATQFYDTLKQSLGLTAHEMDLLSSIRKNDQEEWREFFVKFGSDAGVFVLDAPPAARIAFDSRIQTRKELARKTSEENLTIELAIDELIELRQHQDGK